MSEKINSYEQKDPYSIYPNSIGQIEQERLDFLNEQVQFWHNKYANLEKQIQDKIDEYKKERKETLEDENMRGGNLYTHIIYDANIKIEVLEELLK